MALLSPTCYAIIFKHLRTYSFLLVKIFWPLYCVRGSFVTKFWKLAEFCHFLSGWFEKIFNFHKNLVSNSWDDPDMDKCRQGQMFPGQMSLRQLESVLDVLFKVSSKTGQLQMRYCRHWVCVGWGGGMQSHFRVKPNRCVEVMLGVLQ